MAEKGSNVFVENLAVLATPEGMQKYIFGTKKNGAPRAVYDIVRDFTKPKKKKKHKKNKHDDTYSFYINTKKNKKHKKKSKKHDKYWHI